LVPLDILIAGIGVTSALLLFVFPALYQARLGRAGTAQDRDAAMQMGVDVNRVNQTVFGIAAALGGLFRHVGRHVLQPDRYGDEPSRDAQGRCRGGGRRRGQCAGRRGRQPPAGAGGKLRRGGLRHQLPQSVRIPVADRGLVFRPNGLFASAKQAPPEPLTGTFIAPSRPVHIPRWALLVAFAAFALLPFLPVSSYVLQTLINAWLFAMLALSLTLVAGTIGQVSLGHAALLAIGAYTSALLSLDLSVPVSISIICGGLMSAALGTLLISPSFRLRGHYVSIATLAIGEIISLVILNWETVTHGPIGVSGIPPLSIFGLELVGVASIYWFSFRGYGSARASAGAAARLAYRPQFSRHSR
jgi:branched-chain amino acid transport system permease protein